jgi:hypothetical protein
MSAINILDVSNLKFTLVILQSVFMILELVVYVTRLLNMDNNSPKLSPDS